MTNSTGAVTHLRPPPCAQAKANRGILYVDEVNLLDDGLVDVVLDSAASGINTVEREGVSIVHPAKFIMIGSGNAGVGGESHAAASGCHPWLSHPCWHALLLTVQLPGGAAAPATAALQASTRTGAQPCHPTPAHQ